MKISSRADVAPFYAMEVLKAANAKAARGDSVLHLEVGEPGRGAPAGVLAAAHRAIDAGGIGYTEAFGLPELRARIARYYDETHGLNVPVGRIAITTGSSGGFVLSLIAAFDVGDRVALGVPCYPAYRNMFKALGIEPVYLRTTLETRFQPTPEMLAAAGPVDGLLIASPANPSGTMLVGQPLHALVDYCNAHDVRLISDEVYHGITYERAAETILGNSKGGIVLNGFSKYYGMTGWRLGWMVLPDDMTAPMERLAQNLYISSNAVSQRAALAAFDCRDELERNVEVYRRNRDLLLEALPRAGITEMAPADGAFYIFANVGRLTNDSADFCARLLAETGVALTPGIDFDTEEGHAYIRISFAGKTDAIRDAADRIVSWLS
ncbi:MAG: aminotransferase class I/II-fold pyridoxal phosphate-dependent enzyme [Proteobacteria bacterium]|nr:aminotransferase class I/II-fold pyridoxal phosphate-dependent enzyme [Pseudomonadota bacterium]MDA1058175.1 aminotransferase class I/II-fold pyridoxal phosphate-dependent enzyme [Pseudomonadota bacterium]